MFVKWFDCFYSSKKSKNDESTHLQSKDTDTDDDDVGIVVEYSDSDEILSENTEEYRSNVIGPYSDTEDISSEHQPKINIEYQEEILVDTEEIMVEPDYSLTKTDEGEEFSFMMSDKKSNDDKGDIKEDIVVSFHETEDSIDKQLNEILECSGYIMSEAKKEKTGLMEYDENILNVADILKF